MSHNIEIAADGTGRAAMFSAHVTPWHRLGTVTTGCLDGADALRTAHLAGWDVRLAPIQTAAAISLDGVTAPMDIPDTFATVRTNPFTGAPEVLGVVGDRYTVMQNEATVDLLDTLVDESGAHFETAGSLNTGRRVFVTMKLPKAVLVGGRDLVEHYLILTNSHDGSSSVQIMVSPTRVVCSNTLAVATGNANAKFNIRHTSGMHGRVEEARRVLGLSWKYVDAFEAQAQALIEAEFTRTEFSALIDAVWPDTTAKATSTRGSARSATIRENRTGDLMKLWSVADTQADIRGTKWAALNAITEYADHFGQGDANRKAERVITGGADQVKSKALALLV